MTRLERVCLVLGSAGAVLALLGLVALIGAWSA